MVCQDDCDFSEYNENIQKVNCSCKAQKSSSYFELMKINSDELEENSEGNEEFVLISVLEFFCKNFIRGFNKLIFDLGLDSIVENE